MIGESARTGPPGIGAWAALAQGVYYIVTGVWPLLNIRSFQFVTGPKVDLWLVKTVGILLAVIGSVLALAGLRRRITPEISTLAIGSAAGLMAIDATYVARRRISSIYLADAVAELALIVLWGWIRLFDRGK